MTYYQKCTQRTLYANQIVRLNNKLKMLDMNCYDRITHTQKSLNFLVVGPKGSGKKSLLQTLYYAVNKSREMKTRQYKSDQITYQKYEIKRSEKKRIEGLSVLKEMQQKTSINGYKLRSQKNKTIVELLRQLLEKQNIRNQINLVIICLSAAQILNNDDAAWVDSIVKLLDQSYMHYIVVGTHIDQVVNDSFEDGDFSQEKVMMIADWREYIQSLLKIRDRADIFCIENYPCGGTNLGNSQSTNYYALLLLEQCLQKIQHKKEPNKKHLLNFLCFGHCK